MMCFTPPRRAGHFNPRSPHGERLTAMRWMYFRGAFQPTLPARGATKKPLTDRVASGISTHAPRTGSDYAFAGHMQRKLGFQPTLPARGATGVSQQANAVNSSFQPTLPARGATSACLKMSSPVSYFNPRSPHGERPNCAVCAVRDRAISTHAPRTGSDEHSSPRTLHGQNFNPRSPHGERLDTARITQADGLHFNPRSPHGERQIKS